MRVAFLGLGLIGGSIAHALRDAPGHWSVTAWSPSGVGPRLALQARVVDAAATSIEQAIDGADLVVLAAPPVDCLGLLDALAGPLRASLAADVVVTDVASTKVAITDHARALGLPFVGGHPLAGREVAGFEAADGTLFRGRPWVIVTGADEHAGTVAEAEAATRVEELAIACGARPVRMGAATHDSVVAGISHMPLIVSAALVDSVAGTGIEPRPDWGQAEDLAATGWTGMTRLAHGDPAMGAGIAATNAFAIAGRLRDLRVAIDDWLGLLEAPGGPDETAIRERLAAARARLEGER